MWGIIIYKIRLLTLTLTSCSHLDADFYILFQNAENTLEAAGKELLCPFKIAEQADRDVAHFKDPDSNADDEALGEINMFQKTMTHV